MKRTERDSMMKCLLSMLLLVTTVASQNIIPSKDSLWVSNNLSFSRSDALLITNNTSGAVWIDSAVIEFDVLDTVGISSFIATDRLETAWEEHYKKDSTMQYVWSMAQAGVNRFLLKNKFEGTLLRKSGTISARGDTIVIGRMEIGHCFVCASMPRYPKYLRGVMHVYFNEGRTVSIRLYSNDLRPVSTGGVEAHFRRAVASPERKQFLINGRMVMEQGAGATGKRSKPMQRVYNLPRTQ